MSAQFPIERTCPHCANVSTVSTEMEAGDARRCPCGEVTWCSYCHAAPYTRRWQPPELAQYHVKVCRTCWDHAAAERAAWLRGDYTPKPSTVSDKDGDA